MEMLGRVRRMYYRDRLSRSEIARRTGLSRNTVKKWLRAGESVEPHYRRARKPGKLSAFEGWLLKALQADAGRLKRDRRTAKALYAELKAQGLDYDQRMEQLEKLENGEPLTHRLVMLPGVSRRRRRVLGPMQSRLFDL